MIDKFLNIRYWTAETNGQFFEALNDYFDEDKCEIISQVTKELLTRGDNMNLTAAEIILIYATQHYFNVDDTNYKALIYYRLGELYEIYREDFVKCYTYYEKYALNNTVNSGEHALLLRALILRDDFTYSDNLEKELRMSYGEQDLGLRIDRIYENLGALIVERHYGITEEREKELIKRLKAIIKADELIFPDLILRKDAVRDMLYVPQKVRDYIYSL